VERVIALSAEHLNCGCGSMLPARRAVVLAGFVLLHCVAQAGAQNFPEKQIKIIVPFGPGGPTDVAARLVAQSLQSAFGQSAIVDNRPGAGGAIGARAVASAEPDGHTLLLGSSATLAIVPAVLKNPGFDPLRNFTPVAKISDSCEVLIVHPSFVANSVEELVQEAKAKPGALNYASAGPGNQTHLVAEMFKAGKGIDLVHVPYKSGAEMVTAVLGQQVHMAFVDISVLLPLIREGKLKALAVTSANRNKTLPQVPTLIESGLQEFVVTFWTGVVAPAGTPAPIIDRLNSAINSTLRSPESQNIISNLGGETDAGPPSHFQKYLQGEVMRWNSVAKAIGVSVD
jgi:tripartite-type tricarboxylate transporter receptor subunit TctC